MKRTLPAALLLVLLARFAVPDAARAASDAAVLRACAGVYLGKWIRPKLLITSTGATTDQYESLPIRLRIPSRKGRTKSTVDLTEPGTKRLIAPLATRWDKPRVARGGATVRYRGRTVWQITKTGSAVDFSGIIFATVRKAGSRRVIRDGLIRVYYKPTNARYVGKFTARK